MKKEKRELLSQTPSVMSDGEHEHLCADAGHPVEDPIPFGLSDVP